MISTHMENRRYIKLRILSYSVIAYMMLAFGWWSVLLFTKNQDAFEAKKEQMVLVKIARGEISQAAQIENNPDFLELRRAYRQQERMISGEVVVFILILAIGLWLIHNGYNKEIRSAEQRRNFLLSITHELKSPIASIRLVMDTIRKRQLKPEQKNLLIDNGLVEVERLHQLVNNLLLSARLESAYQPNREMVNLPALLEELQDMIQTKHSNLRMKTLIGENIPFFMGDKMGISSVILNLYENAIKYSNDPAQITTRLKKVKDHIHLEIADQGIGISEKDKKKVFDKFYRVGNEDTRKTKGTGLGLYIVKQIVEAHHGTIRIKNNDPQGTVFIINLPATSKVISNDTALETKPVPSS